MRWFRSSRGMLALGVMLLAVLCLVRPGANRLRSRIVSSISLALGRSVEVSAVRLRFLPQPGFELDNFVVHDDTAFGAEPMLRAQQVTALLRLTSLFRGHLEIATLSLTEPSLNLVRNPEGHWNLENLVERADRISAAPTSKAKSEKRPAFPYIEARDGRINFKFGAEKKAYALTNADFALWQDSENTWSMRLRAQPVRTDFNLSDTGILSIEGSWQRAAALRETPVRFSFLWDRAQLGQLTKLAYGNDKGWRGGLRFTATLSGTPANLNVTVAGAAEDFRRYDITGGNNIRLAALCTAHYSSIDNTVSAADCSAPVGEGSLRLTGSISNSLGARSYDLAFAAESIPMQALTALIKHAKLGIPDDLLVQGELNARVSLHTTGEARRAHSGWSGGGEISEVRLRSNSTGADLDPSDIAFTVSGDGTSSRVSVNPFRIPLGHAAPALLQGRASYDGYDFELKGDAQLQRLLQAARMAGMPALQTTAAGSAKLDLRIAGNWSRFAPAGITGRAHLSSVRSRTRFLDAPLDIVAADVLLASNQTQVNHLVATMAGTSWHGSLALPRHCVALANCPINFDLRADQIATDRWLSEFFPKTPQEPWYRFTSTSSRAGFLSLVALNATGKLAMDKVVFHNMAVNKVSARIQAQNGKVEVTDLLAEFLGGQHRGNWNADFNFLPPRYNFAGVVGRVTLDQLSTAMNNPWITGLGNATYQVTASGLTPSELLASVAGTSQVELRNGTFPHIMLTEHDSGLQVQRLDAHILIRAGKFEIQSGSLQTAGEEYQLGGTASLSHVLNLRLTREGAPGFNITGTLAQPHVTPTAAADAQAALRR